jgi:hypothetical protein
MAKLPHSSNRPKAATKSAHPVGTHKEVVTSPNKRVVSRVGRVLADSKAERVLASRMLRDIRETAEDLSARADRLIRRVS